MGTSVAKSLSCLFVCFALGIGFVGCDESSSSDDVAQLLAPTGNPATLPGTWSLTVQHNVHNSGSNLVGGGECQEGTFDVDHVLGITQITDTTYQVIPWVGDPITATRTGDTLKFDLPVPDGIGTTTSHVAITFIPDLDGNYISFTGEFDYTYNEVPDWTCTGTDSWDGVKATGEYSGLWTLTTTLIDTDCNSSFPIETLVIDNFPLADVEDRLLIALPGTSDVIEAVFLDESTVEIDTNYSTDDGDYVTVSGTLTIAEDGDTIGGGPDDELSFMVFSDGETCTGSASFVFTR